MSGPSASILAIVFGLGVFAIIMAVGWRSVQNRRILRMQDADGDETIIIAREDDDISSVVTTTDSVQSEGDVQVEVSGNDRLRRVVSSTR